MEEQEKKRPFRIDFGLEGRSSGARVTLFRQAMLAKGFVPPAEIVADGEIHSFPADKEDSANKAWYRLSRSLTGDGYFANWKTSEKYRWDGNQVVPAPHRALGKHKRPRERARTPEATNECVQSALKLWERALPASPRHPYLIKKKIGPHCARELNGGLLVPMSDVDGHISNIHRIDRTGSKRFVKGCPVSGAHLVLGGPIDEILLVAEGFATAATVHECTGLPTVAAMSATNLSQVSTELRTKYPRVRFFFCADNDEGTQLHTGRNPGVSCATKAANLVGGLVIVPDFGNIRKGAKGAAKLTDFNDLAAAAGAEVVRDRIMHAITSAPRLVALTINEIISRQFPPREFMLEPWLATQSLNMCYAWRGIGKTWFALWLAYAVASGSSFLKWRAPKPCPVLYVDGEMPGPSISERLKAIRKAFGKCEPEGYFRVITPDVQFAGIPDLASEHGQRELDDVIGDAKLIILDNLSALFRGEARENDAESWLAVSPWMLRKRAEGKSILFIHHAGKSRAQRGTSKKGRLVGHHDIPGRPRGKQDKSRCSLCSRFSEVPRVVRRGDAAIRS